MKKIAIIGASYLQLPLVLKILELGYEAICFSWEKGAVAKDVCSKFYPISIIEKESILKICIEEKIDGILTIASDIAMPTVAYIAKEMNLISNSIESVMQSTNKFLMRKIFAQNNLNIPDFYKIKDTEEKSEVKLNYPLVVKPTDGSGSRGVTIVRSEKYFKKSVLLAIKESLSGEAIIEKFIEGKEISVEIISYKKNHTVLTLTDKITSGEPNFVELEQHQPYFSGSSLDNKIKDVAIKSVESLGIEYGASHVELMVTEDEDIYVIEVGARMGGDFIGSHLVELSTGYDFLKGVVDISLGNYSKPVLSKENKYSGVYFLSSKTKWVEKLINSYKDESVIWDIDSEKRELTCSGDRYGYFMYQCDNLEQRDKLISNLN